METKGFPPLNTVQRYQLRVLFPPCLPCRGAYFSSLAQVANISPRLREVNRGRGPTWRPPGHIGGLNAWCEIDNVTNPASRQKPAMVGPVAGSASQMQKLCKAALAASLV